MSRDAPRTRTRLLLGLASTLAASGVAVLLWPHLRPERESVVFVDDSAELEALMSRKVTRPEEAEMDLHELGRDLAAHLAQLEPEEVLALSAPLRLQEQRGVRGSCEAVPGVLFRRRPHFSGRREFAEHPNGGFERRTNAQGWHEDVDLGEKRGPRLLVIGDSHVAGVVANEESYPNVLEARRRARGAEGLEVWNAAMGAYGPANYLGALTAYGHLDLDVLIVTIYGGNDPSDALGFWQLAYGIRKVGGAKEHIKLIHVLEGSRGLLGQEVVQAIHFALDPAAAPAAERAVTAMLLELAREGEERGVDLLVVYLPSPSTGQPRFFAERVREAIVLAGLDPEVLAQTDRIADGTLAALEREGVSTLDLRPRFAACPEPLYWDTDLHLNVAGHRVTAEEVDAALGELPIR